MIAIDPAVATALDELPLTRLIHFTPSRNLPHILRDGELRSVAEMENDVRAFFSVTDRLRLDGHPDKVCCSLQYPNSYYFEIARASRESVNFPDWICLLINKHAAAAEGTLFCPRNAAAVSGALLAPGVDGLRACYAQTVTGQGGRARSRGPRHNPASPTDVQAEVLVTAPIPLSEVHAVVAPSDEAAAQEYGRLEQIGLEPNSLPWRVSAGMFERFDVVAAVTYSRLMEERAWFPDPTNLPRP